MSTFYNRTNGSLLNGLSDFWQRLFVDRTKLAVLYQGYEQQLAQLYFEILREVTCLNVSDMPLLDQRTWDLVFIREDLRSYNDLTSQWEFSISQDVRGCNWLCNRVIEPTVVWESGVDYTVLPGKLSLPYNPFDVGSYGFSGVPLNVRSVTPEVYATRLDGRLTSGSDTFTATGVYQTSSTGFTTGSNREFFAATPIFVPDDVGSTLEYFGFSATIVTVVSSTKVILSANNMSVASGLKFSLINPRVFIPQHVGEYIQIDDQRLGAVTTYQIVAYIDAFNVTLSAAAPATVRDFKWTRQGPSTIREAVFWAPQVSIEQYRLQDLHGAILGRLSESTEVYRAYILGVQQYLTGGPTLNNIKSALDVIVGIPVVREDGERVIALLNNDTVVTTRNTYKVPVGSIREDLSIGSVLRSLESLTSVFDVADYVSDPAWWHNARLPASRVVNPTAARLGGSAQVYALRVGTDRVNVGDSRLRVGMDRMLTDREIVEGSDLVRISANTVLTRNVDLKLEDVGKNIKIGDDLFAATDLTPNDVDPPVFTLVLSSDPGDITPEIVGVRAGLISNGVFTGTGPYTVTVVDPIFVSSDIGQDLQAHGLGKFKIVGYVSPTVVTAARMSVPTTGAISATAVVVRLRKGDGDVLYAEGSSFSSDLVGRSIYWTSTMSFYEIVDVVSSMELRVSPLDGALQFSPGDTGAMRVGVAWSLEDRQSLGHQSGYTLWTDYMRKHIFSVKYNPEEYDLPFSRIPSEFDSIILNGKSSYTTLVTSADVDLADFIEISDSLEEVHVDAELVESFNVVDSDLVVGEDVLVGDTYGTSFVPGEYIRYDEFGARVEIGSSATVDKVKFSYSFSSSDPLDSIIFDVEIYNGVSWEILHAAVQIGAASSPVFTTDTYGLRLAVNNVLLTGTATCAILATDLISSANKIIQTAPPRRVVRSCDIYSSVLTSPYAIFCPGDVGRVLDLYDNLVVITEFVSDMQVRVADALTNLPLASLLFVDWTFLEHRGYATAISVGGARPDLYNYLNGQSFGDWPVIVTYDWSV